MRLKRISVRRVRQRRTAPGLAYPEGAGYELDRVDHIRLDRIEAWRPDLRALSFRLLLDGRNAMIDRLAFKIGESDVRVRGMVEEWWISMGSWM